MPVVKGKHYPYTARGIAAAKKAKQLADKKKSTIGKTIVAAPKRRKK